GIAVVPPKGYFPQDDTGLIFGGTGITAVALLAILIILLVDMIGGGSANNPIAYLPSNYTLAASIRVRNLLDRAVSVPQIKPQIDEALNNAVSQGFDPRDMQEVFIVVDGLDGYIAAKLSRPVGLSSLPGISSSGESHQGMPIYTMSNRKSANLPIGVSPSMQTMYYVTPSANLLIGATKSERLKEAIDRAKEGRGGRLDLPTGYDLALRAKTHGVHQSHGGIIASFNKVHGYLVTLRWTDTLSFNADIDTEDAQTANALQQRFSPLRAAHPIKPGLSSLPISRDGTIFFTPSRRQESTHALVTTSHRLDRSYGDRRVQWDRGGPGNEPLPPSPCPAPRPPSPLADGRAGNAAQAPSSHPGGQNLRRSGQERRRRTHAADKPVGHHGQGPFGSVQRDEGPHHQIVDQPHVFQPPHHQPAPARRERNTDRNTDGRHSHLGR
ncbi:MAG: hypothetical protein B7Z73_14195, partial [Planctomycetia bacterium 21-64-5]